MARARRVFHAKNIFADGTIMEITVWQLPTRTTERPHGLKNSLFFGRPGQRWVGYDNERGKGDHKHVMGVETPYRYIDTERLMRDFMADVKRVRSLS